MKVACLFVYTLVIYSTPLLCQDSVQRKNTALLISESGKSDIILSLIHREVMADVFDFGLGHHYYKPRGQSFLPLMNRLGYFSTRTEYSDQKINFAIKSLKFQEFYGLSLLNHMDTLSRSYYNLGLYFSSVEKDYRTAKKYLKKAIVHYDLCDEASTTGITLNKVKVRNNLGLVNQQLGNHEQAKRLFDEGLKIAFENPIPQRNVEIANIYNGI